MEQNGMLRRELIKMKENLLKAGTPKGVEQKDTESDDEMDMEQAKEDLKEDGDENCDQCSFQTNNMRALNKHMETAHQGQIAYTCDQCMNDFGDKLELRKHILSAHKSFKPCRNYFTDGGCPFREACHFSHTKVRPNMQRCYKCGNELENVNTLMQHRKDIHKEVCKDGALGKCRFSQATCYLNHLPENPNTPNTNTQDFCSANPSKEPPGLDKKVNQEQMTSVLKQIAALLGSILQ